MSDPVIRVENLSKKYIIGHQKQERYTALRDVISNKAKSVWQGLTGRSKPNFEESSEEFWALKDVSFEIKQGDRVGIIGRNGAGKSTLLKILSRITEPTSGKISIKGRVASLLEVGTGFHPELTGRENVYLNGAILGMDRSEIKKKFDEIVAFAEVEKFLDTPVKRYSSGMYVRLAFAVAAHLEPEILIVDEVLAVGDAQFQKKCLGKMEDVGKEGRTVLFVSHNITAIQSLCTLGLLLDKGITQGIQGVDEAIRSYQVSNDPPLAEECLKPLKYFNLHSLKFYGSDDSFFKTFGSATLKICFSGKEDLLYADMYVCIKNDMEQTLVGFSLQDLTNKVFSAPKDKVLDITLEIDSLPLMPGNYKLFIEIKDMGQNKWEFLSQGIDLEVVESPIYGVQSTRNKFWYGVFGVKVRPSVELRDG